MTKLLRFVMLVVTGEVAASSPRSHVAATAKPVAKASRKQGVAKSNALTRARMLGLRIAEADLADSGGEYPIAKVRDLLHGASASRIAERIQEGSLLAVPGAGAQRRFPAVQFKDDGSVVEGLRAVRAALPTQNPWVVLNFLVHPDRRLNGRKPIDLLKAGHIEDVIEAARSMDQPGG